jgi:hypothetical protein
MPVALASQKKSRDGFREAKLVLKSDGRKSGSIHTLTEFDQLGLALTGFD